MPEKVTYKQGDFVTRFPDRSRPYETIVVPEPEPEKDSYWRARAAGCWPGLQIAGDGAFVFVTRCKGIVYLFKTADEARACKCRAGANCDPIRNHQRVRMQWIAPVKCGHWEE